MNIKYVITAGQTETPVINGNINNFSFKFQLSKTIGSDMNVVWIFENESSPITGIVVIVYCDSNDWEGATLTPMIKPLTVEGVDFVKMTNYAVTADNILTIRF